MDNNSNYGEIEIEEVARSIEQNLLDSFKVGKFKSIRKKLTFYLSSAFIVFTMIVCTMSLFGNYFSTMITLKDTLKIATTESAQNFSNQINFFHTCMKDISQYDMFTDSKKNKNAIIELLEYKTQEYWCYTTFIDLDGFDIQTGEFLGNTDYFLGALSGNLTVSNAVSINGKNVMPIAAPAYNKEKIVGVMLLTPDTDYMNYLLNMVPTSERGNKIIIDSKGNYVLSSNPGEFIGNQYNPLQDSSVSPSEIKMVNNAIKGEAGYDNYQRGVDWFSTAYAPIEYTNGWVIVSNSYSIDFLSHLIFIIVLSIVVCWIVSAIIVSQVRRTINNFVHPIEVCIDRVALLAIGKVNDPVEIFETGDEVEELSRCLERIVFGMSTLVKDQSYLLNEMASGNFTIESRNPEIYIGDFTPLLVYLNKIITDMNGMLSQISTASVEVTFGSENVSTSAQSLAMGAHSQEQSSEALLNSFEQISTGIVISSEKALKAQELTDRTGKEVKIGNAHMIDLRKAMADIYDSSQQISNIINSIKDVALQTNILSLNAAVEAARAGSAGAGFAVVAEEVRELALRSSRSAKDTEKLITATLEAVERGSQITNATADSLDVIVACIEEAIVAINDIAGTMTDQTQEVKIVIRSLEEISQVINTTSCTSQESAAVSEELSAQAQALSDLVMKFNLKS